jgi:uncharacterized membrane protein YbhN (UPF0104 family)
LPLGHALFALLLYAVAQLISGVRWWLIGRRLGLDVPLLEYFRLYFVGTLFNFLLPSSVGGDVVRAVQLGSGSQRRRAAVCSVLADRLSGVGLLLAVGSVGLICAPGHLPGWLRWCVWAMTAVAVAGALLVQLRPGFAQRVPVLGLPFECVEVLLRPRRTLFVTTVLSLVIQAFNVWLVVVLGSGLHLAVPAAVYWALVPTVTLLTLLPISVNGMGVREGAMVLLLAPYGITTAQAVSLGFVWFATTSATSLAGVVCWLLGRSPRSEVRHHDRSVGDHPDQGRKLELEAAA